MNSIALTIRLAIMGIVLAIFPGSLNGQTYVELQKAYDETSIIEKTGSMAALGSRFQGLDGNYYNLKEFFFEDRPVFLSLNYANCPQLCQNQLKMLAERFAEAKMVPGVDFEFISISIDPRESQINTRKAKESFERLMGIGPGSAGIHFLVGKKYDIDLVAKSIGFVYTFLPSANHYSHAPLCVALSPTGKISRYIHGLAFTPEDLLESKRIASEEKVADESIASFVYRCLLFGVNPGQYTGSLMGIMRIAGAVTVLVLGACVIPFWWRAQRNTPSQKTGEAIKSASDKLGEHKQTTDVKNPLQTNITTKAD